MESNVANTAPNPSMVGSANANPTTTYPGDSGAGTSLHERLRARVAPSSVQWGSPTHSRSYNTYSNTNQSAANSNSDNNVVLNFENADIQSVIKAIGKLSGKNFVIDPRVKGTVNIVSDKPISKADSYKVLEAALRMQGFASVEADGVIKVLPETDAKTYGMRTYSDGSQGSKGSLGDQIITKVFVIQHGSAMQLSNALRPMIAPNNTISVYPNSNAIIITDYATNMERITKIVNQLSAAGPAEVQPVLITLKYAVAADVAQTTQAYLQGGNASGQGGGGGGGMMGGNASDGPPVSLTVEPMTNSIIVFSPVKDRITEVQNLITRLDKDIGSQNNDLHVVYLKNADANHVADVLRVVANGQENPDLTASSSLFKFTTEPTSMFSSTGSSSGGGAPSTGAGGGMSSSMNRSSSSMSGGGGGRGGNTNQNSPKIVIQAEPTTNSLIIEAPEAVYRNLRMIIDMLDVRRAQVMIEAMIANITSTQGGTFGIQWLVGGGNNNVGAIGVSNYGGNGDGLVNMATSVAGSVAALGGGGANPAGGTPTPSLPSINNEMYIGLVTGTTTIGGQTIPTLSALADMIDSNNVGNVISRPTMITLDNEEAKIMVGENVPIPNGSYQNTASANTIVNTNTRQDVGTLLDIKPLITQSGEIQLEIYQENSQIDQTTLTNPNGPSFTKQFMRASLLVDDGQIIALGGMTQDQTTLTTQGIPLLDDIPYLGWLFSWQSRTHSKNNIVLFLRPVIIKNAEGYKALTNDRYKYIVGEQSLIAAKGNLVLPTIKPVTLDNQVPYSNQASPTSIPGQANSQTTNLPVVDMRASAHPQTTTNMLQARTPVGVQTGVTKVSPSMAGSNSGALGITSIPNQATQQQGAAASSGTSLGSVSAGGSASPQ
jgi:general secretion pathway protein D